jgi:hypothetical protein
MAVEAGGAEAAAGGSAMTASRSGAARRPGPQSNYKARHARPQRAAPARTSRPRTLQPQVAGSKTAGQQGMQPQVASQNGSSPRRMSPEERQQRRQEREQDRREQQGRARQQRAVTHLTSGTYHRIVIAEFLATVLIIAAAPFLVPRDTSSGTPAEEAAAAVKSLALSKPLTRLTAVCVIFFVLALTANGERTGRVAAAFGALVMLGAMLNATDTWTALGQVFTGAAGPPPKPAGERVGQ